MKRILALCMVILMLCSMTACGKKELQMSGSFLDNITDFTDAQHQAAPDREEISGVARAYLQGVTYEIRELDEERGIATLEVRVPCFTEALPRIVADVLAEHGDAAYDEQLALVRAELEKALSDKNAEKTTTTMELPFEEVDGAYKLIYNEAWETAVFGSLEEMYIAYYRTLIGGLSDEIPE